MKMFSLMILFVLFMSSYSYVPCSCNYECKAIKKCPFGIVKDHCGCCQVCAKGVGEACGGILNIHGICADYLECVYPLSMSNTERIIKGGFCTGYE